MTSRRVVEQLLSDARELERKLVKTILETLRAMLEGRITRREAAHIFLELYTKAPLPDTIEDVLAMLILIDEEPSVGASTREELSQIMIRLQQLVEAW